MFLQNFNLLKFQIFNVLKCNLAHSVFILGYRWPCPWKRGRECDLYFVYVILALTENHIPNILHVDFHRSLTPSYSLNMICSILLVNWDFKDQTITIISWNISTDLNPPNRPFKSATTCFKSNRFSAWWDQRLKVIGCV